VQSDPGVGAPRAHLPHPEADARLLRPGGVYGGTEVVQELERTLKIGDEFLRYLTVAVSTQRRKEPRSKLKKAQAEGASGAADAGAAVTD